MSASRVALRVPEPADGRRRWLEAAVERFAVPSDPKANRATLRLAEAISRHAGHDGICRASRRVLMEETGIGQAYVVQAGQRDLIDAGLLHQTNPGAPSRHGAKYALVLNGTLIRGGDREDAPKLGAGWGFKIGKAGRREYGWRHPAAEVEPDPGGDWMDAPRPYCEHTFRTCSPNCPEWGGR